MFYQSDWNFFQRFIKNLNLPMTIVSAPYKDAPDFDQGIRRLVFPQSGCLEVYQALDKQVKDNIIYRVYDEYRCNYMMFRSPDNIYCIIGPYVLTETHPKELLLDLKNSSLPAYMIPQVEKYFQNIMLLSNEGLLLSILCTLGESMWGDLNSFKVQDCNAFPITQSNDPSTVLENQPPEEPRLSMQLLEDRYSAENSLIEAVSQGQTHKAEISMSSFGTALLEQRTSTPLRDMKNYTIILNTVLRKAAERGAVHPLHIDRLSGSFARKIELLPSVEAADALQREMIHKYCLLVQSHSLKGYSLLIRKVLIRIDTDLTGDLSLSAQADALNVNASYLSTLFKKEVGSSLTEYVNKKRIDRAILLLNTTSLQIQTIAGYCGIPDVNYFTKTFKKYVGKTPKEYRDSIHPYKQQK